MKTTVHYPIFLEVLREHCGAKRGRQVELANHLGALKSNVSDWVHARTKPNHETTLRILAWLPVVKRTSIFKKTKPTK